MKAFSPNVNVRVPQFDEVKAHFRAHKFTYGLAAGIFLGHILSKSVNKTSQSITIVLPRE